MPLSKIQTTGNQVVPNLGRRNLVINGSHRIAQRGTSAVTVTTSAQYRSVDRWKSDIDGSHGHDWSHEQSTDAPVGFSYSSKATVVTNGAQPSATAAHQFYTMLEQQDVKHLEWGTSNAKAVTFSFYVKSSVTGKHGIRFVHYGSSTNPVYNTHYTINTADTWERKTITVTGPTTGGITSTVTDQALIVEFKLGVSSANHGLSGYQAWQTTNTQTTESDTIYLPATSGATWFVTGCQLEVGSVATEFDFRRFSDELHACKRYYEVYDNSNSYYFAQGAYTASTTALYQMSWEVEKRAIPTVTLSAGSTFILTRPGTSNAAGGTMATGNRSKRNMYIQSSSNPSSSTTGHGTSIATYTNSYVRIDAEL